MGKRQDEGRRTREEWQGCSNRKLQLKATVNEPVRTLESDLLDEQARERERGKEDEIKMELLEICKALESGKCVRKHRKS